MKVAKESLPIVAVSGLAALAAGFLLHALASIPFLLLLLFTLWFFRDPERQPLEGAGLIVSPAEFARVSEQEGQRLADMQGADDQMYLEPVRPDRPAPPSPTLHQPVSSPFP